MRSVVLGCLLVTIAGCDLYWDQNPPPPPPPPPPCETPPVANGPAQRDPETGACEVAVSCPCGACPAQPLLGGDCSGICEGLGESDCLATATCHAEYFTDNNGSAGPAFAACWDIQPLIPLEGGDCTQLDAFTCAQHDDCVSWMNNPIDGGPFFLTCQPEPKPLVNTCANMSCGANEACIVHCDLAGTCTPSCIPTVDLGSCDPNLSTCNVDAPRCPSGTEPGVVNECWSDYCVPDGECKP